MEGDELLQGKVYTAPLKKMGQAKNWTKEDKQYLSDNYGSLSYKTLAKNLNRTETAIEVMARRLKLGAFLENGDYVTWNQFQIAIGCGTSSGYKMISWVDNREFPLHTKRVRNNAFKIVYVHEFWKWAEKNKDLMDFSKMEENILGEEPLWAKVKRKHDFEKSQKYKTSPWTKSEDEYLKILLQKFKYSYDDLSKLLKRTNGAIQRRICDLGYKERPIKADNHIKWTDEEYSLLTDLIKQGYGYDLISEQIGKSSKAIRGRVFNMYLTENLDKVRKYIGQGSWGDNRPERKIKQYKLMSIDEKELVKELMTRLTAILKFVEVEEWQNGM